MLQLDGDGIGDAVEVPWRHYSIAAEETARFRGFRHFFENAIAGARTSQAFRLAGRRYLRAVQIAGVHPSGDDEYEDALLQHVFALEALLNLGAREAISSALAIRAAWLVGTSDRARQQVVRMVKDLYGARSDVVHGRKAKKAANRGQALAEVQDLLRRVLVGLLALRAATNSDKECFDVLESATVMQRSQIAIADSIVKSSQLIAPTVKWPQPVWNVEYD
jgi:hypothetical protein